VRTWRIIIIAVVFSAILAAAWWFIPIRENLAVVLSWVQGLGPAGGAFLALFMVFSSMFLLPVMPLVLGAGFVYGVWAGALLSSVGVTAGACAAFAVGRTFARRRVSAMVAGSLKASAIDRAVTGNGFRMVVMLRLSLLIPFILLNYVLSVSSIPARKYALATWIGTLLPVLLYSYIGASARSIVALSLGDPGADRTILLVTIFGAIITLAAVAAIVIAARREIKRSIAE
jgi:uncharacterized membrane protein YdjX (TVP38/TMEM64 family)